MKNDETRSLRFAQGGDANIVAMRGEPIEQVVTVVAKEAAGDTVMVLYLKFENEAGWHRLFLDAGIGFGETCNQILEAEDNGANELSFFPKASAWGLRGQTIRQAYVQHGEPQGFDRWVLELSGGGRLELVYVDENNIESNTRLCFIPPADF